MSRKFRCSEEEKWTSLAYVRALCSTHGHWSNDIMLPGFNFFFFNEMVIRSVLRGVLSVLRFKKCFKCFKNMFIHYLAQCVEHNTYSIIVIHFCHHSVIILSNI